jgi:hypothetical protein
MKHLKIASILLVLVLLSTACSPTPRQSTLMRGWVSSSEPLSGANLSVLSLKGEKIYQSERAVTSEIGSFSFAINKKLPSDFRVVCTKSSGDGLENIELTADVRGYVTEKDVIEINLVTTLISGYLDTHKGTTLAEAEKTVKAFLEIPDYVDIMTGSRGIEGYFSSSTYLREAAQKGGNAAFKGQLLSDISSGKITHPFINPKGLMANTGEIPTAGLLDSLMGGAASYAGGQLMGWGLSLVGISPPKDATAEAIKAMQQTLLDIKNSIDNLEKKLGDFQKEFEKEITKTQYLTMMNSITNETTNIKGLHARLAALVAASVGNGNTPSASPTPTGQNWPNSERDSIIAQIDPLITEKDAIHDLLVGNVPGYEPLISVWSRMYGQNHRFLTSDTYTDVSEWYSCFEQYQVYLTELAVEYYHAKGQPAKYTTDLINGVKAQIQQQKAMLPQQVPAGVFVDTTTGKMWMQKPMFNSTGAGYKQEGQIGESTSDYWNDISHRDTDFVSRGGPLWFVYGSLQNYHVDQPNGGSPLNSQITYTDPGRFWSQVFTPLPGDLYSPATRNFGFSDWIMPRDADLTALMGAYSGNKATEEWFTANGAFPAGSTLDSIWGNSGGNVWTGEWYWSNVSGGREVVNMQTIGVYKSPGAAIAILKEGSAQVGSLFPCRTITANEKYYVKMQQ